MTRTQHLISKTYTCCCILSTLVAFAVQASGTTFSFDDLNIPKEGLTIPLTTYHGLNFTYFSAFDPKSHGLQGLINPLDLNCAVSAPNALLGSRLYEDGPAASFQISNSSSALDGESDRTFALQKLMIKPMVAPEPGTNLTIRGFRDDNETMSWSVWFPSGYHDMFEVRIEEFSRAKWDKLRKVEILADFGYDGLDWEFCIDDLVVEFSGGNGEGNKIDMEASVAAKAQSLLEME